LLLSISNTVTTATGAAGIAYYAVISYNSRSSLFLISVVLACDVTAGVAAAEYSGP
jgi:hypothetical protein